MISLLLITDGQTTDVTQLTSSFSHTGRKGGAGRSFSATLLDSPAFQRSGLDVMKGFRCVAFDDGVEIFQGLVTSQSRGRDNTISFTARDNLIYLANNDDTFCYKDKKASEVFADLCSRFGISFGDVADTGYVIPELSIESGKLWDCILEGLQATYKATGERFYVISEKGKANLIKRVDHIQEVIISEGSNLLNYTLDKSIDGIVTRLKVISDNGAVASYEENADLEAKIGIFQKITQKDDSLNDGQVTSEASASLAIESAGSESLSIESLGERSVLAGSAIRLVISELGISQSCYVDEDTHTYEGDLHTMSLSLNKTDEF